MQTACSRAAHVLIRGEDGFRVCERHLLAEKLEHCDECGAVDRALLVSVEHLEEVLRRERLARREAHRAARVRRVARVEREAELLERDAPTPLRVAATKVRARLGLRQRDLEVREQYLELFKVDATGAVDIVLVKELPFQYIA